MFLHEDSVERPHVCRALAQFWAERNVEQIVDVALPQIETADKPGDQALRISADSHRRGRRSPSGDGTTGPSDSQCVEDRESPAGAVRPQSVDVPVIKQLMQRHIPQIHGVLKTVEAPPAQFAGRLVDVPLPVITQARQATWGTSLKCHCRTPRRKSRRWSRPFPRSAPGASSRNSTTFPEAKCCWATTKLRRGPRLQDHGTRGRPDAGYDDTSLPPPYGVAGALAWLSSRPARNEQPLVQHKSHGYHVRWAHAASSRW